MAHPPLPSPVRRHPLEDEPARLERIVNVMWAEIHKVLNRLAPARRRSGGSDVAALIGEPVRDELLSSGRVSAMDVLADGLADLLLTSETEVTTSWEALATSPGKTKAESSL